MQKELLSAVKKINGCRKVRNNKRYKWMLTISYAILLGNLIFQILLLSCRVSQRTLQHCDTLVAAPTATSTPPKYDEDSSCANSSKTEEQNKEGDSGTVKRKTGKTDTAG